MSSKDTKTRYVVTDVRSDIVFAAESDQHLIDKHGWTGLAKMVACKEFDAVKFETMLANRQNLKTGDTVTGMCPRDVEQCLKIGWIKPA